jgi:hypothetical protein
MALSAHKASEQLQEYLEEIEQFMADSAIDQVVVYEAKRATAGD